jgi:uncharacterized membrane protein YuzA (DUF378 family)
MLREIKNVIQLVVSLMCVFGAIAVVLSDILNIDLCKFLFGASILSIILGSIPFLNGAGTDKN